MHTAHTVSLRARHVCLQGGGRGGALDRQLLLAGRGLWLHQSSMQGLTYSMHGSMGSRLVAWHEVPTVADSGCTHGGGHTGLHTTLSHARRFHSYTPHPASNPAAIEQADLPMRSSSASSSTMRGRLATTFRDAGGREGG